MMNILAFDTCLDKMYVTLAMDGRSKDSRIVLNHDEKYHSAFLISTIKDVLKKNNIKPEDIDLIATNIGPGSFTGIRACTTVARVMAQQLNCKCIGISSLEILSKITKEESCPVALDARKNKAYLYFENEIRGAVDIEDVKTLLEGKNFVTDNKLQPIIGGFSYQQTEVELGDILAKLAYERFEDSDCDWRKLKPLYIQPPPMG